VDKKGEESPVKKGEVEEDENLFHGKDSPMKKGDTTKSGKESNKN
jgi:hypothetical protein